MDRTPKIFWAEPLPNSAGMAADTPRLNTAGLSSDYANNQDKLFVRQFALGGRAEVVLGELAEKKGGISGVRAYGKRMASDHNDTHPRLVDIGVKAQPAAPLDLDAEHLSLKNRLSNLNGRELDDKYLLSQIQEHQKAVNLLLSETSLGQGATLTKYAGDTLPVVMTHLEMAQTELAALRQTAPGRL